MSLGLCTGLCQSIASIAQPCVRQCWLQKNVQHMKPVDIAQSSRGSTPKKFEVLKLYLIIDCFYIELQELKLQAIY